MSAFENTFEYTFQNHFQFGYRSEKTGDTRWLTDRRGPHDPQGSMTASEVFVARYGRARSSPSSWRDANRLAAHEIISAAKKSNLQLTVCFSGGIDSEVTLVSFVEALRELPPGDRPQLEVATLCDVHGLNAHDIEFVDRFEEAHRRRRRSASGEDSVDLVFSKYFLDFENFFKRADLPHLVEKSEMLSPILNAHLNLFDQIFERSPKALPIIGQGELYLARSDNDSKPFFSAVASRSPELYGDLPWSVVETENLCGLYKYFLRLGRPAVPGFFQFLPEQFETQLRLNPVLNELVANKRQGKLGTRSSKAEIIAFDYPELEPRPKFTGFEKLEVLHDEIRASLSRKFPHLEAKWSMPVSELRQALAPKDVRLHKDPQST